MPSPTYIAATPLILPAAFTAGDADPTGTTPGPGYATGPESEATMDTALKWKTTLTGEFSALINATRIVSPTGAVICATWPNRGASGLPPGAPYLTIGGHIIYWTVESSSVVKIGKGSQGKMTINWVGPYFLPPDTASIKPENQAPKIERHPIFASLNTLDLSIVHAAAQAPNAMMRNTASQALAATSNPTLATLLYNKLLAGKQNWYLPALRYTWTTHYVYGYQPGTQAFAVIQSPAKLGAVPLVNNLVSTYQYLREADDIDFVGGLQNIVKFTSSWIGAPYGFWDTDLYPVA